MVPQGISAEMIADQWELTREELDAFGLRSQQFAATATAEGRFEREILPVLGAGGAIVTADEGVCRGDDARVARPAQAGLPPRGGRRQVTAGNSSQISDGAAAVLIMSEEKADALGLTPRARFRRSPWPGPTRSSCSRRRSRRRRRCSPGPGSTLDDIDVVEINEAFASVVLAWQRELRPRHGAGERQRRRDRPRPPARLLRARG